MGSKVREIYRMLIEAVYSKWNSEKFDDVPRLMDKYMDQEAEIYDRIVRKYVFCRPQKDWQPLIEAMYARFNPSKLKELESIFTKYKESEAALYRALCDKYLPTLQNNDPFVFNVWDADASASQRQDAGLQLDLQEEPLFRREEMAGVNDLPAEASKSDQKQRRALRPKGAPKPCAATSPPGEPSGLDEALRPASNASNASNELEELQQPQQVEKPMERRRKRRKVPQSLEAPDAHALANLEQRRQQLKEKLLELKTQISTHQAHNSLPQSSNSFWGPEACAGAMEGGSGSDSDSEEGCEGLWGTAEEAETRTVMLRNQLEAQLRAKLTK